MCPVIVGSASDCHVLVECREAYRQIANEPEWINERGARIVCPLRIEVGIACVGPGKREDTGGAKQQGWM